jgi:hypothetical protein
LAQQLRGLAGSAAAQHSAAAAAAATPAPSIDVDADGNAAPALTTVKMNLCTAVNDALHIAMAEDSRWALLRGRRGGGLLQEAARLCFGHRLRLGALGNR